MLTELTQVYDTLNGLYEDAWERSGTWTPQHCYNARYYREIRDALDIVLEQLNNAKDSAMYLHRED